VLLFTYFIVSFKGIDPLVAAAIYGALIVVLNCLVLLALGWVFFLRKTEAMTTMTIFLISAAVLFKFAWVGFSIYVGWHYLSHNLNYMTGGAFVTLLILSLLASVGQKKVLV